MDTVGEFPCESVSTPAVHPSAQAVRERVVQAVTAQPRPVSPMIGLRFHAMLGLGRDCVLIHGGRHFKSKDNISGTLFAFVRIGRNKSSWFEVPLEEKVFRFGHQIALTDDGRLISVGGFSSDSDKDVAPTQEIKICTQQN